MGGRNVKNTIVERILQSIAPHPCFGCGKIGTLLCDYCKYDITNEPFWGCLLCGAPSLVGICEQHDSPISRSFIVAKRADALEQLINGLKFQHVKDAARCLAQLFDTCLPLLPADVAFVPVPTLRSHVRQRGYDQVELVTRQLAALRSVPIIPALRRRGTTVQHRVGRQERFEQAQDMFSLAVDAAGLQGKTVLLIDDIVTTGSTLSAAASVLAGAGATVWAAAIAYQPLDSIDVIC